MFFNSKKLRQTIVTIVMILAMITSSVYAAETNIQDSLGSQEIFAGTWNLQEAESSSTADYCIQIISESLEELKNFKVNGGEADIISNRLGNKIGSISLFKDKFRPGDMDRLNRLLDEVYAEANGVAGFEGVLDKIDEVKNGLKKEESDTPPQEAPKKEPLVQSFTDVRTGDWFYDTVMNMTARGLFAGKGEVVNGVGIFAPQDAMKRAEFNAVLARILFGDIANEQVVGKPWWYKSDSLLRNSAIVGINDFTDSVEVAMTREEMAYMCQKSFDWGRIWGSKISKDPVVYDNFDGAKDIIPDYGNIDVRYVKAVEFCYSQGILCGVDNQGTFKPKGNLTRAEAATVIYRLLEKEARTPVDLSVES
jgi:hypothetical protein